MSINNLLNMFKRNHIRRISKRKKLYLLCWKEALTILCHMWTNTGLLKNSTKTDWRQNTISVWKTPMLYRLLLRLTAFLSDYLWFSIVPETITIDIRPISRWMSHSGKVITVAFIGSACNSDSVISVSILKRDLSEKTSCYKSQASVHVNKPNVW